MSSAQRLTLAERIHHSLDVRLPWLAALKKNKLI